MQKLLLTTLCVMGLLLAAGCNDDSDDSTGASAMSGQTANSSTGGGASPGNGSPGDASGEEGNGTGDNGFPALPEPGTGSNGSFDAYGNNGLFLSILPPGEDDNAFGKNPHFDDRLEKYRQLTHAPEDLTTDQLTPTYFDSEQFRARDSFPDKALTTVTGQKYSAQYAIGNESGVPHVYGDKRTDVYYGIGYVNALNRMFLMDALRHIGRGRLTDFIGSDPANYGMDRDISLFAGYSEKEIHQQIQLVARQYGKTGTELLRDARAFIAGINTYIDKANNPLDRSVTLPPVYSALGLRLRHFTVRDVLATAILIESRFGVGGGSEYNNVKLLNGIAGQVGKNDEACQLWHDILESDDPSRPTTTTKRFATQSPNTIDTSACPFDASFKSTYPGAVMFDPGSFSKRTALTFEKCTRLGLFGKPRCPDIRRDKPIEKRFGDKGEDTTSNAPAPSNAPDERREAPDMATPDFSELQQLSRANTPQAGPAESSWLRVTEDKHDRQMRQGRLLARQTIHGLAERMDDGNRSLLPTPRTMSNALVVSGDYTQNGHPLAVFGPQTGYFAPELELEFDAHGGGMDTRGMNFAGLPFILIGRGKDFAWSATSASADISDTRVLKICHPGQAGSDSNESSQGYLYQGRCKPFYKRVDRWTAERNLNGLGEPNQLVTRTILRAPDYGPIVGFARVDGQKVAVAIQRSTFMHTLGAALPFSFLNDNTVHDPKSFMQAFNLENATFNWFYLDSKNIAYFMSGLLPKRSQGIYPELPQWGDGNYDWAQQRTGQVEQDFSRANFLPLADHPHVANPERGYLTSWNNAPAPGFYAADNTYSWGPVHRVDMLNKRLTRFIADDKLYPADLVTIMMDGGSTDLRGQEILPDALEILRKSGEKPALTDAEQGALSILSDWLDMGPEQLGAMRRDRDDDGIYDDRQAVVLMDAWYNRMIDKTLPQLVALEDSQLGNVMPLGRDNRPSKQGSAYQSGYYGYLQRVFAMTLDTADHPYGALQCAGSGKLSDCRRALIASLDGALDALGGIDNRSNWDGTQDSNGELGRNDSSGEQTVEQRDMISFRTLGIKGVDDILWQNRPTFQQVVSPTTSRGAN